MHRCSRLALWIVLAAIAGQASAGPLRELLAERRAARQQQAGEEDDGYGSAGRVSLPPGVKRIADVAYGRERAQRFDVYTPAEPVSGAPVIFMVHGGGWRRGDKAMQQVVENKVAHWVPKGYIVISTNYRMLPEADVATQAADVAQALRHAEDKAAQWGGDRNKFVLMGHSAGAHLVALLSSDPARALPARWLGTVELDSAGMDIELVMQGSHYRLYDQAFGTDPAYWKQLSPYAALSAPQRPMLEVCSTRRPEACQQAEHYAAKARGLGMQATVLRQDLSHKDINQTLGQDNAYTAAVDGFLAALIGANRASR